MNNNDKTYELIVREIFQLAGYDVTDDDYRNKYCFDFLATYDNKKYGVDVKMQPRNYSELLPTFEYIVRRNVQHAHNRELIPIIVINGIVSLPVKEEIKELYEDAEIIDISNLIAAVPIQSEVRDKLLSVIPYSTDDIKPVESDLIHPWIQHASYEDALIIELQALATGRPEFQKYEDLCKRILIATFNDQLTLWKPQKISNNGLYRFDLLCRIKDNHYSTFWGIVEKNFFSKYVVFEFKNYSKQITQEQIYTTEKYLYSKALRTVAILVSRKGADKNAQWAAKGAFRESGKLILLLDSDDLVKMLQMRVDGEDPSELLLEKLDNLLMELEK